MNIYANMMTVDKYNPDTDSCKEKNFGPTLTDDSEYETLEQILAKCLRGDFSSVSMNPVGFDESASDEEIIAGIPIQETEDFDISDKTTLELKVKDSLKKVNFKKEDANASDKVARPKKTSEEVQSDAKQSEKPQA